MAFRIIHSQIGATMRRRFTGLALALVGLLATFGLAAAPAAAVPPPPSGFTTCSDLFSSGDNSYYPWSSNGSVGESRVCLDSTPGSISYNCFSQVTFYAQSGNPSTCDNDHLVVALHDWTDSPGSDYIYLEYQGWTDQQWHTARMASNGNTVLDYYGGPITISQWFVAINLDPAGLRFLRVHDSYTGAFSYIFKSTGAGGCGYEGIPPCPSNAY